MSVIIPTYNRAAYLQRALSSVFLQSYQDFEVIVVDDGSTDGTCDELKSYGNRIRTFSITHSGVSRARNTGIRHARGEWIAFLDSDDYWLPKKLEKQVTYLLEKRSLHTEHPYYRICHTDEIWMKNGKRINQGKKHKKYEGWFFNPSLHLCLISPSSVILHRQVFETVGYFNENFEYVEDYDLWLRVTSRFPIGYIDEKLVVKTGGHADQLSKRILGIEKYRIIALENIIRSGSLKNDFLREAVRVYKKKGNIYIQGCVRRGKLKEMEQFQSRMNMVLSTVTTVPVRI